MPLVTLEAIEDQTLPSLRSVVLAASGQDVRHCWRCSDCAQLWGEDSDLSLEGLLQLVPMDDEEALTSKTLWSDRVLAGARHICAKRLDMEAVMRSLRDEAVRRGLRAGG